MPELPEVETTLRGIKPHLEQQEIRYITVRHSQLRWPIPADIAVKLSGQKITQLRRRGKYLLLTLSCGTLILHLGMSGRLKILQEPAPPPQKHDHVDIGFANGVLLRFTDPRRFGAILWYGGDPSQHALLKNLGPEPLERNFSGQYLWQLARSRKLPIKSFIMDAKVVVGVGNIYANEALFLAGIHPLAPAASLSLAQYHELVATIKTVLRQAIKQGGTTLKDFYNSEGKPGYFATQLTVYGREGLPCLRCKTLLQSLRIAQRSTVYCPQCQAS